MAADIDRSALILYGSETGNAQDMAEDLGRLCSRLHFRTDVDELDSVDLVRDSTPVPRRILTRVTELSAAVSAGLLRHLNYWAR